MESWTRLVILGFIFTLAISSSSGKPDCSKLGPDHPHCQGNQGGEEPTTKKPTTKKPTTKPPTTTTKPPTTTTKPPTTTTKPPTTTTKPPTTTTKPPTTTTKPPTTTTKPPTTTTKPPTTTTKPPTTITKPLTTTTKPPTTTTKPPTTTTKPPTTTTKPSTTTTKPPTTTTNPPTTTTKHPTTTTKPPTTTTKPPTTTTKSPTTTTKTPTTTSKPATTTTKAPTTTTKPKTTTTKPAPSTTNPATTSTKPAATTIKQATTTTKAKPTTTASTKAKTTTISATSTATNGKTTTTGATKTTADTQTTTAKRATKSPKSTGGSKQDLEEEIDNTLKNIANLDTKTQVKEIEELTENIISKATTEENEQKSEQNDTVQTKNDLNEFENVANLVSKIAAHVPKGERIVIDEAESGIVGSVENIQIEEDKMSVGISLGTDKTNQKSLPSIVLPIDRFKKKGANLDMTVATLFSNKTKNSTAPFKNDEKNVVGSQEGAQSTYSIGSGVLSIQVVINGSSESVAPEFSLPVQKNNKENQQEVPICVFWDPEEGHFSQEGVTTVKGDGDHVQCQANHTTSFAVLMQTSEVKISDRNLEILDAMTIILTPFSIIGLGLTIIVFHVAKLRKSGRNKIHFNLSFSLFFGQLIFLTAVDQNADYTACLMIAMVLHYFFLSSFGWMLIEGINLYYKIVKVSGESKLRRRYYNLVGWGIPIPIVLVTAAIRFTTYVSPDSCWLNRADGVIWAFAGPASVVICVNSALLVQVGCILYNSLSAMKEINSTAGMRTSIIGTVLLTPILGITWAFGLLAIGEAAVIFQYCFVLGNCLQGVFIFAIFVLFNSEVRAAINLSRKKRRLVNTVIPCDLQKVTTGKRSLRSTSSDGTEVSTLSDAETTSGDGGSNIALRETDRPLSTREVSVGHQ